MNKFLCLLFTLLLIPFFASAQRSSEAGIFIGASNYMGDLAPSPLAANETQLAFGGHFRHMLNPKMGVKGAITYGKISGSDANVPLQEPREGVRRWEMEAGLLEIGLQGEWHFLGTPRFNNAGVYSRQFSPFIAVGLGLAFANAEVTAPDNDKTRFPEAGDKSTFFSIPLTLGVRFDINESLIMSGEFGVRGIFSDYLDGLSQLAGPNHNDYYMFTGISVLYMIEAEYGPSYSN